MCVRVCVCVCAWVAQVPVAELRAAGLGVTPLQARGFSASELLSGGFAAAALFDAKFSHAQLAAANITPALLRAGGYSLEQLRVAGYSAHELRQEGAFSIREIFDGRAACTPAWTHRDLEAANITAADLHEEGVLLKDIVGAGYSLSQVRRQHVPVVPSATRHSPEVLDDAPCWMLIGHLK